MKFQVIGLGSIGMRHAKNLLAMGHEVWGCEPDREALFKARDMGINIDGWEEKSDGVIIASPTDTHAKYLRGAIKNNIHVLVEKPIADKPDGIAELLAEARRRNLVVMVGNNLRFNAAVQDAKKLLGKPESAIFTIKQHNTKYKESVILNWGAHEIDEALYLLGPAKVESACGTDRDAQIFLRHENGCRTEIHLDYLAEPEIRYSRIYRADGMELHYDKIVRDSDYVDEMQAFIDRINGKEALGATGEDGLATLQIINDAQRMAGLI